MEFEIRTAHDGDAEELSQLILWTLRETNANDYSAEIIDRVGQSFSPTAVRRLLDKRQAFVAVAAGRIVGTASLDGNVVRTVFVAPDMQGRGIGKLLIAAIERVARQAGIPVLTVPSSVTAEGFYSRLGFRAVRDSYYGEERTIIMERDLPLP